MRRTVVVMRKATADVEEIYTWLGKRSLSGAETWYRAFTEAVRKLSVDADIHPLAPESRKAGVDLRELLFKTPKGRRYRLLYLIVDDDEVRVLRVWAPGLPPVKRRDLK